MSNVNWSTVKSKAVSEIYDTLEREVPTFKDRAGRFYFASEENVEDYAYQLLEEHGGNKSNALSDLLYTMYGGLEAYTKGISVEHSYVLSYYDRIENDFMYWFNETYVNDRYDTSGNLLVGTYDEISEIQADASEVLYAEIGAFDFDKALSILSEAVKN